MILGLEPFAFANTFAGPLSPDDGYIWWELCRKDYLWHEVNKSYEDEFFLLPDAQDSWDNITKPYEDEFFPIDSADDSWAELKQSNTNIKRC